MEQLNRFKKKNRDKVRKCRAESKGLKYDSVEELEYHVEDGKR